jgi:cell division initiation protein
MELSAKVLREVEFRDRLRGYDTDEVDEFLEKVAVAVDENQEKMRELTLRAERAERAVSERTSEEDDDSIRRTLVLAQRTADLAIREAQEQAAVIMDTARSESDKLLADARENAQELASEAERRHSADIARLENQRNQVRQELEELSEQLEAERERLAESLRATLRFVEKTLPPPIQVAEDRLVPAASPAGRGVDDIEAQINEDAQAAAPTAPPAASDLDDEEDEDQDAGAGGERPSLAAVPPVEDSGPDTQAWHVDSMTIVSQGGDKDAGATYDTSSRLFGSLGPDWIA